MLSIREEKNDSITFSSVKEFRILSSYLFTFVGITGIWFMERIIINTPRLTLKSITPSYIRHLFSGFSKAEIQNILGGSDEQYIRYEQMNAMGMETSKTTFLYFSILLEGEPIGECGFHTWHTTHDRAELFYNIHQEIYKRKGYISEVVPFVIRYGFEIMQLNRIEAFIAPWNKISYQVLKRQNFRYEGTARQHYLYNGVYEDSEIYALLRSGWK